jgi:hypothetical protein
MKKLKIFLTAMAVLGMGVIANSQIESILKAGGIALLVDRFGKDINKGVNDLQGFKDSEAVMTKVVPILSVGAGGHIGAAQVMGPPNLVNKVRAVGAIEGDFMGRTLRLRALIPIESNDIKNIKRVVGVGVSAIIDIKI